MIVYKITNLVNSKSYIGQTIHSLGHRQNQHYRSVRGGSQCYIHNAIRKYGNDQFSWEILEYCKTQEELNEKEIHLIQVHRSHWKDNGYNLSLGGDGNGGLCGEVNGMYGRKHSEETLEKMRQSRKGQHAGDKNPSAIHAGTHKITFPDGHQEDIKNLKKWCRESEFDHRPFYSMSNSKRTKPYKGYWCERIG